MSGAHFQPMWDKGGAHFQPMWDKGVKPKWLQGKLLHSWLLQGLISHEWGAFPTDAGQRCQAKMATRQALCLR